MEIMNVENNEVSTEFYFTNGSGILASAIEVNKEISINKTQK